jgi:hypothetical protein
MLATIRLDHETCLEAHEVDNIYAEGLLASELEAT